MDVSNERQEPKTAKELAEGTVLNAYNNAYPDEMHREWMIKNGINHGAEKYHWEVRHGLKVPQRCSKCGVLGHNKQTCKRRV